MERLAMLLAERVISLDPHLATRILWDAAKLYGASTSAEERKQLLHFQTQICALVDRPTVAVDAESRTGAQGEHQLEHARSDKGVSGLTS